MRMGMGGVPLSGGTLSPQYTLVNSDGASLRVHTGSIRERNLNRRISAIHEDDSDAYSESRRSDSLVFVHSLSPSSSVLQRRRYRLYSHQQQQHQQHQQQHQQLMTTTPSDAMLRGRVSEDDASVYYAGAGAACGIGNGAGMADVAGDAAAGGMARALGESDCFSMVSGISEGGASTTRVRMATDRAYDALRIGPSNNAAYGYGHGGQYYPHRPMSFATSSDPGLPSAGSYYDYYLGPDDYVPPSSAFPDDSDFNDDQSGEIISLIRSDVAVYSGAGDDVKFPFLPDNFSELGASIVYSPGGALSVDLDRLSRDQSDFSYGTPAASNYYAYQTPEPSAAQQTMDSAHQGHHYHRLRPQMKLRKKGKGVKPPSVSSGHDGATGGGSGARETGQGLGAMAANAMSRPKISAAAGGGGSNPASPSSATNELHRRYTRRYRNQSASDAYHHHQTATQAAAQAVAEAVAASGGGSSSSPPMRADTGAIRPNALMRFIKRITPKN
ncbi:hypothetical protein LPJ75_005576 [Coemansia sp. RSA 2598]|nr:hypothetical protein LPJ75_005576 [Coemansia sp. RSA 2598]